MMIPRVLLIEDEAALSAALETALRRIGCAVESVATGRAGLERWEMQPFSLIVLDIGLPDQSGLNVLETIRQQDERTPVLVITAHGHLDNAIAARNLGATEYLVKPLDLRHFQETIRILLEHQSGPTRPSAPETARAPLFVGGAASLQTAFAAIARACAVDTTVYISGPSGSGKSLAARLIHEQSARRSESLRFIHSGEWRETESAEHQLNAVATGTVVIEEIAQLSAAAQLQILEYLEASAVTSRARFLATSSVNLREATAAGRFREDLFYLLSVAEVPLPPLRERLSDLPALAAALLARHEPHAAELTPSALQALQQYEWPGNVRELQYVLNYAATTARGQPILRSHLPAFIVSQASGNLSVEAMLKQSLEQWVETKSQQGEELTYDGLLQPIERALLEALLPRYAHKPSRMAVALKMHRTTLRQKLARLGMKDEGE
jgi:DNA-binding NtrC family response regulator